ncbi:hypothetical protein OG413_12155 [Streptomyces sp. NBC_01433]|uniref:hypothetical protein n=1 Tax=Streptomyces sp. NBC_01433 TaxID=2903864 RepID=UPI00225311D0|nr:hypothetical protein [Streptomyces sp. NBC_01433]MCX4676049.1 hypothetical protein [Streptomyces sp. NBC_01433]
MREVHEELGIKPGIGRLLVVDWRSSTSSTVAVSVRTTASRSRSKPTSSAATTSTTSESCRNSPSPASYAESPLTSRLTRRARPST